MALVCIALLLAGYLEYRFIIVPGLPHLPQNAHTIGATDEYDDALTSRKTSGVTKDFVFDKSAGQPASPAGNRGSANQSNDD